MLSEGNTHDVFGETRFRSTENQLLEDELPFGASHQALMFGAERSHHKSTRGSFTDGGGMTIKSHQCPICPYTTQYSCNLRRHVASHTGEKKFACTLCPYRSGDQTNLRRHIQCHQKKASSAISFNSQII